MNPQQLLDELERQVASGTISREQVTARLRLPVASAEAPAGLSTWLQHLSIANIFYVIGAVIVLSGIVFLVAQVWDDLGSVSRIAITLGLGWLLTMLGVMLRTSAANATVATVFYALGGALVPGGALVFLNEQSLDTDWGYTVAFLLVSVVYALLLVVHRHVLVTALLIANATATLYLFTNAILDPVLTGTQLETFYQYLTMVVGISYLLLGYSFRGSWNKPVVRLLYLAGATSALWAAFLRVPESIAWEFTYWLVVLLALGISVWLRSRIILVVSTIFLLVYVSYITFEYFADSIGWPVALVLLGFLFIGLGYLSISINRRFIADPAALQ